MKLGKSKPIQPSTAFFVLLYATIAVGRQIWRDLKTLERLTRP